MRFIRRALKLVRFRSHDAELTEEMAFHRESIERDLIARGHSPDSARDAARRVMGNETFMREESRGVWLGKLEGILQDARATMRGLRKSPAFTLGVILTFALGIGANAAIFSLVDRLMLRPPALLREPSMVHRVYLYKIREGVERETGGQYARYADLARWTTAFSQLAAYLSRDLAVGVGDDTREARIGIVSAGFFDFFDAPPAAGRYFTTAEDSVPVGTPVAVVSYATWQGRYGGRHETIGQTLQIGAVVYTIIGVAPPEFVGLWPLRAPVAFIPITTYAATRRQDWATTYTTAIGAETLVRRKPGVTVAAAAADLTQAFTRSYATQVNLDPRNLPVSAAKPRAIAASVHLERGPRRSGVATVAIWLAGVTVIVLLIACANVANLLLTRAIARRREIALRVALGVTRGRLVAQLMIESIMLAALGGALGILVAVAISNALRAYVLPGADHVSLLNDGRTVAFMATIAVVVGICTGVLPLMQARRLTLRDDLASGARSGAHRSGARASLLVLQAALSVVLLVGAGLFVRSMRNALDVDIGFDADKVLLVETTMRDVPLDSAGKVTLRQRLLDAAVSIPEVAHASFQESVPLSGGGSSFGLYVAGIDSVETIGEFYLNTVTADYFATMGTRILRGRGIESGDLATSPRVAVVGRSMAAALWPGKEPIGQCMRVMSPNAPCTTVVGIAEDIHSHTLGAEDRLYYYYLAAMQVRPELGGLFVRARFDAAAALEPVRRRLQREMPGSAYVTVTPLRNNVDNEMRSWVMGATAFTAFGALALVLAAIGLYSAIGYNVAQRRQELAVRVALGAATRDVVGLVVMGGLRVAALGIVIGGAIAVAAGRWVEPLLFNQSPRDPAVFGAVIGALLLVAIVASVIPARRAARTDPRIALGDG